MGAANRSSSSGLAESVLEGLVDLSPLQACIESGNELGSPRLTNNPPSPNLGTRRT